MKTLSVLVWAMLSLPLAVQSAALPGEGRELTAEEQKEVEQLKQDLNRQLASGESELVVKAAKQIAAYRAQRQGAEHWQVKDARLEVQRWQSLTGVVAKDRPEVVRALRLDGEGAQLLLRLRYREAEGKRREALAIKQKLLGEQHRDTALSYNEVGLCLLRQGKHAEALPLFQKALAIWLKPLGEQHPHTAVSYNNVASCLNSLGKHDEALPLFQKALALRLKALSEQHPDTATSYNQVASCLDSQGKHAEALPLFQKALALRLKALREQHPSTVRSYNNLAVCLDGLGKHAEALPLHQKALALRLKALGEQHPDTARSYNNLAVCLDGLGKHAEALPLHQKALALRLKVLGEQHPDTARSYNNLAFCLSSQGKHADALPLIQKALGLRQQVLGEQHSDTAQSYNSLAFCLNKQGKHAEALPLYQKALAIRLKVLGEQHPDTATSYNNVAVCLKGQGKYAEALLLYQKALTIDQKVLGEQHPDTATSYNRVGNCLGWQGKPGEALPLHQKALATHQKVLGEQHPHTASSYYYLASCLHLQGKPGEALPLYQKALAIFRKVLGEHPDTAFSYNSLAFCLNDQGKPGEALPLFQKALDIRRKVLGEQHSLTSSSYNNVAFCLYRQDKHGEAVQHWEKALLGHDAGRLDASASGFDRALFHERIISPRAGLAVTLMRLDQPLRAWQYAESDLGRGLLDALLRAADTPADAQRRARLDRLNQELLPLLTREHLDAEQSKQRDARLQERDARLVEMAAAASRRSEEDVFPLERIQKQLRPDAAVVFWLDVHDQHLGCVLRHQGSPRWVKLPGSGKDDAWTEADTALAERTLAAVADGASHGPDRRRLLGQLHRQRIAPLDPHLEGVRLLVVVPAGLMAKVPVEALNDRYTVCYAPSASLFARSLEQHRALEASSLLVLADPDFTRFAPKWPEPPPQGLLVKAVVPGGLAARMRLQPGDVLLEYADQKLSTAADLKPSSEERVTIKLWRDGKAMAGRVPGGNLGIVVDTRPLAVALADWRKQQGEVLALSRGSKEWAPLPGTRLEARTLAALVPGATALVGPEASEQRLNELFRDGQLKRFRLLHFATHGEANGDFPRQSALVLAQDKLPTPEEESKAVLEGKRLPDGLWSVGDILEGPDLDADLVVLSACQTGLGTFTHRDGMLGFAHALLQKKARSVVLSRWKVDDTATALLMERFYRNLLGKREGLKEGIRRAEALAEAKKWLRELSRAEAEKKLAALVEGVPRGERGRLKDGLPARKPDEKGEDRPFAHSYYWAAFVLIGDPF